MYILNQIYSLFVLFLPQHLILILTIADLTTVFVAFQNFLEHLSKFELILYQ
uniref:Uncharacterized protein n=1 Tax=Myoviridae sp. ctjhW4 TaxID=2825162 RepID=A0A8S5PS71_9CAUD|nr:MAG TPA: hypothetical protein [Myoviridae sp. ctjhW4]